MGMCAFLVIVRIVQLVVKDIKIVICCMLICLVENSYSYCNVRLKWSSVASISSFMRSWDWKIKQCFSGVWWFAFLGSSDVLNLFLKFLHRRSLLFGFWIYTIRMLSVFFFFLGPLFLLPWWCYMGFMSLFYYRSSSSLSFWNFFLIIPFIYFLLFAILLYWSLCTLDWVIRKLQMCFFIIIEFGSCCSYCTRKQTFVC